MSYEISICIPARNEEFLTNTIDDVLKNIEADTEIIVVLDGELANPPIQQNERVTVIYHSKSIGQRAAVREAVAIARGKYIMKLDAHCSLKKGFDRSMIDAFAKTGDNVTMAPTMKNLHIFDWICKNNHRRYQGRSGNCTECGEPTTKDIVWRAKPSPNSTAYCFDSEPHFQYQNEWKKNQHGDIVETMSLQGSCFMMTKKQYVDLDMDSEIFGSWGTEGAEIATKTWLSGGRVLVNRATYQAHCFRTAGGDFSFPYPQSSKQVANAKKVFREIFFNNKWDKQIHPLHWLVEKFWPVPGWTDEALKALKEGGEVPMPNRIAQRGEHVEKRERKPRKGVVYYSHRCKSEPFFEECRKQILKGIKAKHIVSVTDVPIDFGKNIVKEPSEGWIDLFERILIGLEASESDVIFFCEHDVLYSPKHFDFIPLDRTKIYYNKNVWHVRSSDGFAVYYEAKRLSQLCAYRDILIEHYKKRIEKVKENGFSFATGFEPASHNRDERVDDLKSDYWESILPNIDIKYGGNSTKARWRQEDFRSQRSCRGWKEGTIDTIDGWDSLQLKSIIGGNATNT